MILSLFVATTTPARLNVTCVPDDNGAGTTLKEGSDLISVKIGGDDVFIENSTTFTVTVSKVPNAINTVYNCESGELLLL